MRGTLTALQSAASWLDWHSDDRLHHPFTLTMIELLCFTKHVSLSLVLKMCERTTTRVAMAEYLPALMYQPAVGRTRDDHIQRRLDR